MTVIKANKKGLDLLARLMRAEAVEDGSLAELMVGNVGVNRVRVNCLDFKNINNISDMVFQDPGGFTSIHHSFFYRKARTHELKLARKVISGKKYWPASHSLWFFEPSGGCPSQWYGEPFVSRYKSFCYYKPNYSECPSVFNAF